MSIVLCLIKSLQRFLGKCLALCNNLEHLCFTR